VDPMEPYAADDTKRKRRREDGEFAAIPEVKAFAIVSIEGLPIYSSLPQGVDETRLAAMTATLLSLSKKAIGEMNMGNFDHLSIKVSSGYLSILPAGPNAILAVLTTTELNGEYYYKIYKLKNFVKNYIDVDHVQRKIPKEREEPQTKKSSYDHTFKIVLLGDSSLDVEKSAVVKRYFYNIYDPKENMTIGVEYHVKSVECQGKRIKLQIWVVGGEERFRFLLPTYCRNIYGAFLLYDITNPKTLDNISEWTKIVGYEAGNIPIMLVGTKLDLAETQRQVLKDYDLEVAKKNKLDSFAEISTKTGQNIDKIFEEMIELILKRMERGDYIRSRTERHETFDEEIDLDNLPDDKDVLYQELIALEGRRYSLERNFKDVEKNFNKGSISKADFKRQNNILKKQLNEIASRINNIRGIISSL